MPAVAAPLAVLAAGFALYAPRPAPPPSAGIIVISGDEQMARFREGLRLYRAGPGRLLVFSGAARDEGRSNAGVPPRAFVEEPFGEPTGATPLTPGACWRRTVCAAPSWSFRPTTHGVPSSRLQSPILEAASASSPTPPPR